MIHDFAVTRKHIAFLVVPMVTDVAGMKQGRVHFAWDPAAPTWLGVMRRGGDGSDLRWFKGPERCATHTMGCFSDGERLYVDMDMGEKNQFPFFPNKDGSPFDAVAAQGRITRLSVDLAAGFAPRLRDGSAVSAHRRAVTPGRPLPHGALLGGFMPCLDATQPLDPRLAGAPFARSTPGRASITRRARTQSYFGGADVSLQECCFVPRSATRTRRRWLSASVWRSGRSESRSELLILDAQRLAEGPLAHRAHAVPDLQPDPWRGGCRRRNARHST